MPKYSYRFDGTSFTGDKYTYRGPSSNPCSRVLGPTPAEMTSREGINNKIWLISDANTYLFEANPGNADFSAYPTFGFKPLEVQFTDLTGGFPSSWIWDFGDEDPTSEVQNPVHEYLSTGKYTPSLEVVNSLSTLYATKEDYITVCDADFSASPLSGTAPLTVNFTDLTTNDPVSWNWSLGNGSSYEQNPSAIYSNAGQYSISLIVENFCGQTTITKTNYITVTSTSPPDADFSAIPTTGTVPQTIQFTDLSTNNPTSWIWSFGDGETSTAQHPSHQYTASGNYNVTLTSSNAYGKDSCTKFQYIQLTGTPACPSPPYLDFGITIWDSHHVQYHNRSDGEWTNTMWLGEAWYYGTGYITVDPDIVWSGEAPTVYVARMGAHCTLTLTMTLTKVGGGTTSKSKTFNLY